MTRFHLWKIIYEQEINEVIFYLKTEVAIQKKKVFWKYAANYRRTLMSKCDFNKVAKELYWSDTSAWALSCKSAAYFQNSFS